MLILSCVVTIKQSYAQQANDYKWWNPATSKFAVVEGCGWPKEVANPYERLPVRAEQNVRKELWNLSRNSAGLSLSFMAATSEILVRYVVADEKALPHMPATSVSGVDLYDIENKGTWLWCSGGFSFRDTITYRYKVASDDARYNKGRRYRLYLPLYNTVKWMEIGVPYEAKFVPLPVGEEKPIVAYGTSIVQGACASRPGTAWTTMLSRKLDMPLINLGFSGNGLMEKEVFQLMAEIDAKIYIIDCLPNLGHNIVTPEELRKKILAAVSLLRNKNHAPILFVEHSGTNALTSTKWVEDIEELNDLMSQVYHEILSQGHKNIFLLTKEEIKQDGDCFVDGTHPSDLGMKRYAEACAAKMRRVLK